MADAVFPQPVAEVISTLAELYRHKGLNDVVELLENANADVELTDFDNWNGGTCTWALRLQVPIGLFVQVEAELPGLEKELLEKLGYFSRTNPNHSMGEITIVPLAPGTAGASARLHPSEYQVRRLWPVGRFRLFLSHISVHRIAVAKLKEALALRGIAAFVAHEDIEPSLEWQNEIELGLRSMHALAALLTPDFHVSQWTDHEIGWALGRAIPMIPVCYGINPYGLAGKYQGVPGDLNQPGSTAAAILKTLLKNEQTHGEMRRALVSSFRTSDSYVMTQTLSKVIVKLTDFTKEETAALQRACTENRNVAEAYNVPEAIYAILGKPPESAKSPSLDEDVPF